MAALISSAWWPLLAGAVLYVLHAGGACCSCSGGAWGACSEEATSCGGLAGAKRKLEEPVAPVLEEPADPAPKKPNPGTCHTSPPLHVVT